MKVYLEVEEDNRGVSRAITAMKRFKPASVELVDNMNEADVVVLHVTGRRDRMEHVAFSSGKKYVVVQYCLRTTQKPKIKHWVDLWEKAELVWSYFDLKREAALEATPVKFKEFYLAPLGADPDIFYPVETKKNYMILTSGLTYLTESTREAIHAARNVGSKVAHLGSLIEVPDVESFINMPDENLASIYSQCNYVSGLRRHEGFELPAVEGLFCGVRPILFDTPCYREWYYDFGVFIPETNREQIIKDLTSVFTHRDPTVSPEEIEQAKILFNWQTIMKGFWDRVCAV